ncbi:hypothetical protein RA27_11550 [Ruegeria sp. ANG-R]|uniref:MazG nucleotide pyrophosphohydrolase domain-containing protein n=1 Tax=Ruegeria sp. ANG-R TaxID=1577903 RepID=UPI00057C770E|nr:MazG nucleotide pyrophosphohydrolase domain-containing protein [Ruegeria sp. ANG-R]KIC41257.1 hypothetical protein RA27_11550 [Ruegeria sp. ANG-R]
MAENLRDLTELARAVSDIYAKRFEIDRDAAWYLGKMTEELGEVTSAYLKHSGRGRGVCGHDDLADEVGDLLGFLLLFAEWQGIDPGDALRRKWEKHLGVGA